MYILNVYTRKQSLWYTECLYKKTEFMVYWMFIQENRVYGILNVYTRKQMFTQRNRVYGILNVYTRKQSLWYTECLYKKTGFMVYWMFIQENRVYGIWFIQENRVYGILNVYTRKQS